MADLTDAQYLAAARALLLIGPDVTHISKTLVHSSLAETCSVTGFRAALTVAYEAGQRAMRERARSYIAFSARMKDRDGGLPSDALTVLAWQEVAGWMANDEIWDDVPYRSLRDRASDPAVVTAVAASLVGLLDHRVAKPQAAGVITAVLDALEVAP